MDVSVWAIREAMRGGFHRVPMPYPLASQAKIYRSDENEIEAMVEVYEWKQAWVGCLRGLISLARKVVVDKPHRACQIYFGFLIFRGLVYMEANNEAGYTVEIGGFLTFVYYNHMLGRRV